MDPDPRTPEHTDSEIAAAQIAYGWTKRLPADLSRANPPKPAAKKKARPQRTDEDRAADPTETEGKKATKARSGGVCEAGTPWCVGKATNVHHRAGRGFYGCHHPDLLLHVCGNGNVDGCHGFIEQNAPVAYAMGWRLPWGTRAGDVPAAWLPGDVDHRPVTTS